MIVAYLHQRWKASALKKGKTPRTDSELSWMPPSARTGGRCGRVMWGGQCCDPAAAAAATAPCLSAGAATAQLCPDLTTVVCSYQDCLHQDCLQELAAPLKCFAKALFQILNGEKLNFLPFFSLYLMP